VRANLVCMNPQMPKSRLLLMPETRLARPQGERPKVRRYCLTRLPINPSGAALRSGFDSGFEHPKPAAD
jgi:hypothetical protein